MIVIDAISTRPLAVQLRLWRERAMLTQAQLARTTGLGVRTIRRLESQVDRRPRNESIKLLAAGLNLSKDETARLVEAGKTTSRGEPAPRQLPRDLAGFLVRDDELTILDGARPDVVVISGTPGVGKTSLALHWAHRVAASFPDGSLYVNLRGFDPESAPLDPATGVHPATEITVRAAALVAGLSGLAAGALLHELTAAHLLDEPSPGRYLMHDLLRLFARELAGPAEAREAVARLSKQAYES